MNVIMLLKWDRKNADTLLRPNAELLFLGDQRTKDRPVIIAVRKDHRRADCRALIANESSVHRAGDIEWALGIGQLSRDCCRECVTCERCFIDRERSAKCLNLGCLIILVQGKKVCHGTADRTAGRRKACRHRDIGRSYNVTFVKVWTVRKTGKTGIGRAATRRHVGGCRNILIVIYQRKTAARTLIERGLTACCAKRRRAG